MDATRPACNYILGIESSCDDTAVAVLRACDGAILGHSIANQVPLLSHKSWVKICASSKVLASNGEQQDFVSILFRMIQECKQKAKTLHINRFLV